jgi:hypothetical protein
MVHRLRRFEENHKDSSEDPILRQGVDTRARLDEMTTKVYTSDYAFQRDVADLSESWGP